MVEPLQGSQYRNKNRNRMPWTKTGGNLYFGLMNSNLKFLAPNAMSLWDTSLLPKACRWRCDGVGVDEHLTSNSTAAFCSNISTGLHLVGPSSVFQQDDDPKKTSKLSKGYLTKKKESNGVLQQMIRPPQSVPLGPAKTRRTRMIMRPHIQRFQFKGSRVLGLICIMFKTREDPKRRNLYLLSIPLRLMVNTDDVSQILEGVILLLCDINY